MFKTKGGGVKGFLNNVQKNCGSGEGWHPLFSLQQRLLEERKISKHKYLHLTALLENHLFLRCHQTFVTQYESQQEEECEENFRKNCFIEYEKIAFNETVTSNQIWQYGNIVETQIHFRREFAASLL